MAKALLLLPAFLLCDIKIVIAQANDEIKIHSVSAGYSSSWYRDALLNNDLYTGSGSSLSYRITKTAFNRSKEFSVAWESLLLRSGNKSGRLTSMSLQYTDLFRIFTNKSNNRFNAEIGYSINIDPAYLKTADKGAAFYLWNTTNSLGFYQRYHYKFKKSVVKLDINVPLAGLASRPAESNLAMLETTLAGTLFKSYSDLFFTSVHNYKACSLSLEYQFMISRNITAYTGATYKVKALHVLYGSNERSAGINAGIVFKIKQGLLSK